MNSPIQIAEEVEIKAEGLPIDRPRKSGFVLKPMDKDAVIKMLDELIEEDDEEEQRETFRMLKEAIDEGRRARGERLLFEDYE